MSVRLVQPEMPAEFDRTVIIEWPPSPVAGPMPCWPTRVLDAATGEMISVVTRMDLHFSAEGVLWATAEALTGQHGEMLREGVPAPAPVGGFFPTGVFTFLVAEMRAVWPRGPLLPRTTRGWSGCMSPSSGPMPYVLADERARGDDPEAAGRTATFAGFLSPDDCTVVGGLVSIDCERGALLRRDRLQAAVDATGMPGVTVLPGGSSSDAFRSLRPFTIAHGPWSPGGTDYGPERAARDFAASRALAAAAEAALPGAALEVWLLPSVSFLCDYLITPAGEWPPRPEMHTTDGISQARDLPERIEAQVAMPTEAGTGESAETAP